MSKAIHSSRCWREAPQCGGEASFQLTETGQLQLRRAGRATPVRPVRCFPWSEPEELISLRDGDDQEVLLLRNFASLDPESRRALRLALRRVGFILEITRVISVEEENEIRLWRVRTRQGGRVFQTALDSWPWPSPDGGHFVQDLGGDLMLVPPIEQLDPASQNKLWPYVN